VTINPSEINFIHSAAINLQRLVISRVIVIVGQVTTIWVINRRMGLNLALLPLGIILTGMTLVTLATLIRLQQARTIYAGELFIQLVLDVTALTVLFYFTGGGSNPFVILFLLPITFAAAALPMVYAWLLAGFSTICYTILLFNFVELPKSHAGYTHDFQVHVLGMWLSFVLAAGLIAAFVARMSATLRDQDRVVASMRERALLQEQVLALGTLATGAAHELATPLATMAVLVNDLSPNQAVSDAKIQIFRTQINRCKEILSSITATAGAARAEGGAPVALDTWLGEIIHKWQEMRPGIQVRTQFSGYTPVPWIMAEQTLSQAIINILNNAADVSPDEVEVNAQWSADQLVLEVADRGPGLAAELSAISAPLKSTKELNSGLGLGLFLAYTTLSRFGGTVRLMNRADGGVLCQLRLPLSEYSSFISRP